MVNIKSVSEISNEIKEILETNVGLVSIAGEISNYKPHYSGHKYFILKDEYAQINCTMWKTRPINFNLIDGQKTIITGTINVYPPRGSYQIDVLSMIPSGTGDLFQSFELLKQKLDSLGYFKTEIKKELPQLITNIGLSTSPTGAAVQDIITTIRNRFPIANVYFRPTIVQGEFASADIVKAIKELSNIQLDVMIIGRGGGSIEDLWAYNTEEVANAIYNCHIPVISAVGHETDFTIADFTADIRAATPTAAAVLTTPIQLNEMLDFVDKTINKIYSTINQKIKDINNTIKLISLDRVIRGQRNKVNYAYSKVDNLTERMNRTINFVVRDKINKINYLESALISPLHPLEKGFCIIKKNNKIVGNDIKLSDIKTFEIIRQNENVFAKIEETINETLF